MIRWIVENRLGTAPGDSIAGDFPFSIVDTRAMVDKRGNSADEMLAKVREGVAELRRGGSVVVVCDFGVSRSNTLAAGMLAEWRGIDLDSAVAQVIAATGEHAIKLEMVDSLRAALSKSEKSGGQGDGILITGGSGFLGAALRKRLARSHRVLAPHRAAVDLLGPVVHLDHYCRDNKIGKIIHLASPRIYTNNDAMGQSLTMLRGILDVCNSRGIHLYLPSGAMVFSAYRSSSMIADVNTTTRPRGVYGETKFLEEVLVQNARANGEVDSTIVRISPTFGPQSSRPRLIGLAHRYVTEGRAIVTHRYRNGLPALQLLYVDDAVSGLAAIVEKGGSAPIYHLGGDFSYEPREIVSRIGEIIGCRAEIQETKIDDDIANVFLDWSSTETELGWRPTTNLSDGLRRTLAGAASSVSQTEKG
ncbi:NAD-dependent epimerase/dehydratase family protein [Mycobacterium sp. Marseille-P9652]|uniref:NAD-dependent epimerase/dehydratase family protein n=1 Tax=Mycobacterium sp. Marseille-P9652 TaxID=2654950 RepID=UPI0012E7700F|nr:NAD-dependent epimerase/dehydratase family protein [Mycobacterium sp. Marseille-P9652]